MTIPFIVLALDGLIERRDGFAANIGTGHRYARRETCGTEGYPPLLPLVKFPPPAHPEPLRQWYRLQAFRADAQSPHLIARRSSDVTRMDLDDPGHKLFHVQSN
jgi:hypothetical protein